MNHEPRITKLMIFTSFIPPETPIPDPPELKVVGAIASAIVSLLLIGFIGFIFVEFAFDQAGRPLRREEPVPAAENEVRSTIKKVFSAKELHDQFRFISPHERTLLDGKNFVVLCRWRNPGTGIESPPVSPYLWVDEIPTPWTVQFGQDVWFARFELSEGIHRIRALDKEFDVCVGKPKPERKPSLKGPWKRFRMHDGADNPLRCVECHEIINGKTDVVRKGYGLTIGQVRNESCTVCHEKAVVAKKHAKLTEKPGNDCATCHEIHQEELKIKN